MPRYQSKPRVITAVRFIPQGLLPPNLKIRPGASPLLTFEVWNGLHESWIKLKSGDYIRTDDPNDHYPIDEETFNNTYTLIEEDTNG